MAHDVFIIAFENIKSFKGKSSLKTWVFTIATNHVRGFLKKNKPWHTDTHVRTKLLAHKEKDVMASIVRANQEAPLGSYEIREHIDYCFTCVSKMLPLDQQVALILKDIYDFKVKETAMIMNTTDGRVKHFLINSRKKMISIFNDNCALVSKNGIYHQCTGLNGKFNPRQDSQEQLMKIKMMNEKDKQDKKWLFVLRAELVKSIDPMNTNGADLHEAFMKISHEVNA